MASHCPQSKCGFTVYRGVLVQWDEDHDERILDLLDITPVAVLENIVAVQEHEGSIAFLWKDRPPIGYCPGDSVAPGDGDIWHITNHNDHIHTFER